METQINELNINGEVYVKKSAIQTAAPTREGMKYCIVRTYSAGVFAGFVESRSGQEVIMRDARRLWYWKGASSLSQLAQEGVKCPLECKFPVAMDRVELTQAIEIIDVTAKAKASIDSVALWKQ
jgi:hypothetical protein